MIAKIIEIVIEMFNRKKSKKFAFVTSFALWFTCQLLVKFKVELTTFQCWRWREITHEINA